VYQLNSEEGAMMYKINQCILTAFMSFILISCSNGGDSGSASSSTTTEQQVSITGVVVVPNLGPVTAVTVTATDLTTNQELGSINTANADGSYTVPNAKVSNPIIIKVSGGTYLDEATGAQKSLPTNGISACLPNPSTVTKVAVTTVTEIATQAALKSGSVTAASIDAANRNVGSALLGGADPTTTIPIDISKAIPAGATAAEKNYARLLAGIAVDAKNNSGGDLYSAAQRFANVLFDATGAPKLSTGGALPADITNLQAAVQNYAAVGTISAANVPPVDTYATVGLVNPAAANGSVLDYYYMEVFMDSYTAGTGQVSEAILELGLESSDLSTRVANWSAFAANVNGVPETVLGAGVHGVQMNANGQLLWSTPTAPNNQPIKVDFSKDGQFGIGRDFGDNGAQAVRLNLMVKKPKVAPTLASVAGTYQLLLMAHNSGGTPSASAGYTEHGTIVLDGTGGLTYTGVNTDVSTGVPVITTVNGTNTYTVDPYGVVLNTGGNGHLILSDNGIYGLYELHAAGTQEWGVVIKKHTTSVPFTRITSAKAFDIHFQGGAGVMGGFYKAVNRVDFTPVTGSAYNFNMAVTKSFAPIQLAPAVWCGTASTAACTLGGTNAYVPINAADGPNAVNGRFYANPNGAINPAQLSGYVSQDGSVFGFDDGEAAAIVLGLGR